MSEISRQEFDDLSARVQRIERSLHATIELVAAEVVGLRTYLDDRFTSIDSHFDSIDGHLGAIDGHLDSIERRLDISTGRIERIERTVTEIARHLGLIDP